MNGKSLLDDLRGLMSGLMRSLGLNSRRCMREGVVLRVVDGKRL